MVCLRNLSCALLALAVAPGVLASPFANADGALVQRQKNGNSNSNSNSNNNDNSNSSPAAASPSDSPSPSVVTNSPTNSPSATPTPSQNSPTTSNSPTNNSPTRSTAGPTSNNSPPPSQTTSSNNNNNNNNQNSSPTTQQAGPTSSAQQFTQVQTVTQADGKPSTQVVLHTLFTSNGVQQTAAQTVDPSTLADAAAASATSNAQPDPNANKASSGPNTGTIVGAVVGGVAGLVLIGALAAFAYRVWGKKGSRNGEDDGLMDDTYGTSEVKTTNPGSTATPFQSNLEQYHAAGPAQNF